MQYRTLGNTGLSVSTLGFGASSLGSVFRDIDESEGVRCVHRAVELGINLIDCSPYYGLTKAETVLGRALVGLPRDSYYLATKVGRYGPDIPDFDFSAARVKRSVDESLTRLQLDYIDIIQCHDIEFGQLNQIVEETLPALREVIQVGKARFVGITGLPLKVFTEVCQRAQVDTILSYCRYSLNDTSLEAILPAMARLGVGVMGASPLSMGLLTERGAPSWHPAPQEVQRACAQAVEHCRSHGKSIEQLAVQYSVAQPGIASTFVGTANPQNIEKNVRWAQEPLDTQLVAEVQAILAPVRNRSWLSGHPENNDAETELCN